jgi:hypothetical protein
VKLRHDTLAPPSILNKLAGLLLLMQHRGSPVVQTGVKSAGCENKMAQLPSIHSCHLMGPMVVSAVKSAAGTQLKLLALSRDEATACRINCAVDASGNQWLPQLGLHIVQQRLLCWLAICNCASTLQWRCWLAQLVPYSMWAVTWDQMMLLPGATVRCYCHSPGTTLPRRSTLSLDFSG